MKQSKALIDKNDKPATAIYLPKYLPNRSGVYDISKIARKNDKIKAVCHIARIS